jgi:hypothetical protein
MKIALYSLIVIIAIAVINLWYQVYIIGQYYTNSGLFLTILGALAPVVIIYLAYLLITKIKNS